MPRNIDSTQEEHPIIDFCNRLAITIMDTLYFKTELESEISNLQNGRKTVIPDEKLMKNLVDLTKTALFELTTEELAQLSAYRRKKLRSAVDLKQLARAVLTRGTEQRKQLVKRVALLAIEQKLL